MGELISYLPKFSQQKILVVGDIIADEFIEGEPERLSREAPVLILNHNNRSILPGGGTNAANNVAALDGQVYLAGVIGNDSLGVQLKDYLAEQSIKTDGLIVDDTRPTSVKTRILAGGGQTVKQQVVRVDKLKKSDIDSEIEDKLLDYIEQVLPQMDAIILSDYGNGVLTPRVKQEVIRLGNEADKIIAVDSRYELMSFENITIATPNKEETEKALGIKLDSKEKIDEAGRRLLEEMEADAILITLGGDGMAIFDRNGLKKHISAVNYTEIFDVTGAGDTVIGTLVLALASEADLVSAMRLANHAAGIVIRKTGVATTSCQELEKYLTE
ncbi:bifunctional heptose 7-phosphate kinase/heptose 1-phosphate adenyltransferase [Sporohalobacter salinus]|uniref:bifunctional heptose 7-phosphate kinase/heptose 1-phosphate adenyltransferase n=1 Tax=Sporohalobacter salinus TaxID=1494606 RepID=UPI00195FDB97|nr:PfkB family carbohydrate kinase [Sporohalobacter salinus]MBM7623008.1 rfaE bifunctional protein kinase chain/domain [Sporohalobacter salinus]